MMMKKRKENEIDDEGAKVVMRERKWWWKNVKGTKWIMRDESGNERVKMIIKYVKGMNEEWNGWWKKRNDDKKCKRNEEDNEGVKVMMKNMKGTKVSECDEKVIIKTKRERKERYREWKRNIKNWLVLF
jgi:hypothetical protein